MAAPGASWAVWGASGPWPRGPLGGLSGASWKPLGASCRALGGLLGSWDHLGGGRSKEVGRISRSPLRGHENRLLGPSGAALGRPWDRRGGLLGASWGSLGQSWGNLEASKAHRKRKDEKATFIDFLWVFERCLPLGGSRGGSESTWNRLAVLLGPFGDMSEAILSNLRLY